MLLSTASSLTAETVDRVRALNPSKVAVLGGKVALPTTVVDMIHQSVPAASISMYAGTNR